MRQNWMTIRQLTCVLLWSLFLVFFLMHICLCMTIRYICCYKSCVPHLTSWGRLKGEDAVGKLDEIRQIWEPIEKIWGLMGFGKYLQNWTRQWPGCYGNQQCWEVEMSALVRKVLPEVLGDHINSQPTLGLEISLFCFIANLQLGAENISWVKSIL